MVLTEGLFMCLVLVTGGCGFIGSNFVRHLVAAESGVSVVNLDCLTYAGNPENLGDLTTHPRYRWVNGSITDAPLVRQIVGSGVQAIINFAAESHVDRSINDCGPFLATNVLGTQVLLEAARVFKVPRFVQISTDEVYGSMEPNDRANEEAPLRPNSPYAASKASADLLVRSFVQTHGTPAIITRCSNNYGPYQFPEKLLPLFITRLLRGETAPLYGDGLNVRDWLHVRDHCVAIHRVWRNGRVGEIYNVSANCEWTNLALAERLLELLGEPRSLLRFVADRPGHDRRYAMDCAKIKRELGWQPQVSFDEGLPQTVRWYQENADWVTSIQSGAYRRRSCA